MDTIASLNRKLIFLKQREKNLKFRVHIWKQRSIKDREYLKLVIKRYEDMLRDMKTSIELFKKNVFKMTILTLYEKYKLWREGRRK